jgi:hypothetical protein
VLLLAVAGCTDSSPCDNATCPALGGAWAISWQADTTGSCSLAGPQPAQLIFTQDVSTITTTVGGLTLQGTLFDSWDFTATAQSATGGYALRGVVLAATTDAGTPMISGSLQTLSGSSTSCITQEAYTGARL